MEASLDKCWYCKKNESRTEAECGLCHFASYCSFECRDRDVFRHKVECANAVKVLKCNTCNRRRNDLKACTVCFSAFYCDKQCQRKSWESHKQECEKTVEEILSITAERQQLPSYSELPSYIGSSIAEDYLHLKQNEGESTDQTLKLLFVAVGDIRDVVRTVADLPLTFRGKLEFVLNDVSPHIMARNLLFLYSCIVYPKAAGALVQIWYSAHLTPKITKHLAAMLKKLCNETLSSLMAEMQQLVKISKQHWAKCLKIWQGWLRLHQEGLAGVLRLFKENKFKMIPFTKALSDLQVILPKEHNSSVAKFMFDGILLPDSSSQKESAKCGNPTLAHFNPFNAAYASKYQDINNIEPHVQGWGFEFDETTEMIYGVRGDCYAFACWDYLEVKRVAGMKDDLTEMYRSYLETVFEKFTTRVQKGSIKFHILVDGFDKIPQNLSKNEGFDRIALSSLSDYYYIPALLEQFAPLLNRDNKHAVLVSKHVQWHKFTHLLKKIPFRDHVSEVRNVMFDILMRPNILPSPISFCAAPEIFAPYIVDTYLDTYSYFLKSLLAEVVLHLYMTKKAPLSKPSMKKTLRFEQSFRLKMRDYRREMNHVIPFHREGLSRRVALKPNANRYLEWRAL